MRAHGFFQIWVLVSGMAALAAALSLAVSLGAADIGLNEAWRAIFAFDPGRTSDQIIIGVRLPRVLGAAAVGAALAVGGAIMQGLTRNPLAEPGLLGLNAGASLALACVFAFAPGAPYMIAMLACFAGAGLGAALVFGFSLGGRKNMSPVRIALAGSAVSAGLTAVAEGIALTFKLSQNITFWMFGGLSGTNWKHLQFAIPIVATGIASSIALSKFLTVLGFGDDVAIGLGQRILRNKTILLAIVLALAGTAVSLAGSVLFVGLIVPHLARRLVGADYRWIVPCSAIYGALLMVLADTAARTIVAPFEAPVGALLAMIGFPFFIYIAKRRSYP